MNNWTHNDKGYIHTLCSNALKAVLETRLNNVGFTADNFTISVMRHRDGEITVRIDPLHQENKSV